MAIWMKRMGLILGWTLWSSWALFAVWLILYEMPISAGVAFLFLMTSRPWQKIKWAKAIGALLLGLVMVPLAGLPEYIDTTNELHCRTLGFLKKTPSKDCVAEHVQAGRTAAKANAEVFSQRERLAVHGFNLVMALGGYATGFFEVADETLWMSLSADPFKEKYPDKGILGASYNARVRQCKGSYDGVKSEWATPIERDDDFFLRSAAVRKAVANALPKLGSKVGAKKKTKEIHWSYSDQYWHALTVDSIRVALALEVGDSRVQLKRLSETEVQATWSGGIHYPGADVAFKWTIPTLFGPKVLRVSETIFCGMQMDGAMNPYRLSYHTVINMDDSRLNKANVGKSQRGPLHGTLAFIASQI